MKNNNSGPLKKMEEGKNDVTASFPNAEKPSATEINNSNGNKKSRNYMEGDDDINGPDDKESTGADGDTTVNAGIFK